MAKYIQTDTYLAINGTAISDHAEGVAVTDSANKIELTAYSTNAYREFGQGLKDAVVTVDLYADFAASSIHAMLQPLYASGGTFLFELRPTSAAVSATNPRGSMIARLYSYSPFSGKVGDAAKFTAEFANAGTAGLTWGTV